MLNLFRLLKLEMAVKRYKYMNRQLFNPDQFNQTNSFNIYVDLFDRGEFFEMNIHREVNKFQVNLGATYLGTLCRFSDDNWELINGTIPSSLMPDITDKIIYNLNL